MGLSVIIASSARPKLWRTLASTYGQLIPGDELFVDVNDDSPYGNKARTRMMRHAKHSNGLCFIDDDDVYMPDALAAMRSAFESAPDFVHMFRLEHTPGNVIWEAPQITHGNVSTQMIVASLEVIGDATWGERYAGDYDFICEVASHTMISWHETVTVVRNL